MGLVPERRDIHNRMGWVIIAEHQGISKLTRSEWQSFLPGVNVSAQVSSALNTCAVSRLSECRAALDDHSAEVPLFESLDLISEIIVNVLWAGVRTEEGRIRLQILEDVMQLWVRAVRKHCQENRG